MQQQQQPQPQQQQPDAAAKIQKDGDIMSGLMEGGGIGSMGMPTGGMVMSGSQNAPPPPPSASVLAQALQKELPLQGGNPGLGGQRGGPGGGMMMGRGFGGPGGIMPGPRGGGSGLRMPSKI